jgi:hypothetical protein
MQSVSFETLAWHSLTSSDLDITSYFHSQRSVLRILTCLRMHLIHIVFLNIPTLLEEFYWVTSFYLLFLCFTSLLIHVHLALMMLFFWVVTPCRVTGRYKNFGEHTVFTFSSVILTAERSSNLTHISLPTADLDFLPQGFKRTLACNFRSLADPASLYHLRDTTDLCSCNA